MAKPKIHLGESFLDRLIKDTYGKNSLGELSTEQMNELESYMKSDDFKTKSATFRSSDRNKFEGSVDHFFGKNTEKSRTYLLSLSNIDKTKYLIPRLITTTTVPDHSNTNPPSSAVRPSVPGDDPKKITQEQPLTDQLIEIEKSKGFTSLDDVKAFLKKVGLNQTGQLDELSLAKLAWYNHMKTLGYTEGTDLHGQSWFRYGPNTYYNNGKVKLGNGAFSDYDYKTLRKNIDYNASNWRPHDYFRFHYDGTRKVTLPDGTFPVYVVRSGTVGNNNKWNLVEDESYAYDPASGKVRRLLENMFGMVQDQGDLKTPKWVKGEDWIDISTLPFRRSGGLLSTRKLLFNKQGGTMNRIKYFQQGGQAPQQDIQQQVVALVQAAMQGDEKANQTVSQIMEAAKAGDQQAIKLAQMIQAVAKQIQGQATSAKWGSKLGYIRSLKYARGGKACPACEAKQRMITQQACGGKAKKAKKRYFGGWL